MIIRERLSEQLLKLLKLLTELTDVAYVNRIAVLNQATIGQHTRHIIEIIQCLERSHTSGVLDYENKVRNLELENSKQMAIDEVRRLSMAIHKSDRELVLQLPDTHPVTTSYQRELVYCIEHTIHHLALVHVALNSLDFHMDDVTFGVGYSTLNYKAAQCAQ